MNHPTFSLQNILNEPMSPDLCKRILDQIKSPLMEQSFAITNDQSFSNSFVNAPKRPDIPPPSSAINHARPPAIKNKFNTFANGQSFYDQLGQQSYNCNKYATYTEDKNFLQGVTKRYDSQFMNPKFNQQVHNQSRVQMQSVVSPLDPNITSPLDPNITLNKPAQDNFIKGIWSHLCGNVHNVNTQENHEINYNETRSRFQRKKIFDKKGLSVLENTKPPKYTQNQVESILLINENDQKSHIEIQHGSYPKNIQKSVTQVLEQLRRNNHFQIASFIGFLTSVSDLLESAQKQRLFLSENIEVVFQLARSYESPLQSLGFNNQACEKFFHRMNCSSVLEMVQKISRNKLIQNHKSDLKQFNKQKNQVADSLEKMLEAFSQIQKLIEGFIEQHDSISKLRTVHSVLSEKFTSSTTKNTLEQIINLLKDLRLFKYQQKVYHLEYLWESFMTEILSQSQFINGIVKTNGQYRSSLNIDEDGFGSQLSKMGFVKN